MRSTIKNISLVFTLALTLVAQLPPNELVSYDGVGCSYDYTNTYSSRIGCWAAGACRTAPYGNVAYQYPDVSFYQWWTCSYGVVEGKGASLMQSFYDPRYYNDQPFPWGLQVNGNATVWDPMIGVSYYAAVDHQDCDGGQWFSGPYDYVC